MHSKSLSMLGLARRAGKLAMGHDMAKESVTKNKAKLIIICEDASPRLAGEFNRLTGDRKGVELIQSHITMDEVHFAIGYKAAVMAVEDENFSVRIIELLRQEENANDN